MKRILLPLVALILACNPNEPPVVADQVATTDEDTPVTITLQASDADGDALSVIITSGPSNGTLGEVSGLTVEYTPNPDYNGGDSFSYTVSDGGDDGDIGPGNVSITIEPVNDPPEFSAEGDELGFVGRLAEWTAQATDVDGDQLEFTWTVDWDSTTFNGETLLWRPRHAGSYGVSVTVSDGTVDSDPVAFELPVHQIEGGQEHTLWLKPDGTVWAWGDNGQGQLGTGFDRDSAIPQPVCATAGTAPGEPCATVLSDVVQVAAGADFSMALQADGTVLAWGDNTDGQLGDGCTVGVDCVARWLPTAVSVPAGGQDIGAGPLSGYTVNNDGTVFAWGYNETGELGRGDLISSASPLEVCMDWDATGGTCTMPLTGAIQVAGGLDDAEHAGAIREDGTVWMWGDGDDGKRGDGCDNCDAQPYAGQVCTFADPSGTCTGFFQDAEWLDVGEDHTLVLGLDGRLYAFGDNNAGQLGTRCVDGNCDDVAIPEPVCGSINGDICTSYMEDIRSFAAGEDHTVIILGDGTIFTMGDNNDGQLGNGCDGGTTDCPDQTEPIPPCALEADGGCPNPLTGAFGAAAGTDHVVVMLDDGTLVAWGDNNDGQVGDGTAWSSVARPSHPGSDWAHIGAGEDFSVARTTGGAVLTWGSLEDGVLGDGCTTCDDFRAEPSDALIEGAALTDWDGVSAGEKWVLGRRSVNLHAWGNNEDNQLSGGFVGDFSSLANPMITADDGATPTWVAAWAGAWHGVARRADGSLWAWGQGGDGQLGDGLESDATAAVQVLGADGSTYDTDWDIAAPGFEHTLALKTDGTLWAWGEGSDGQIGDGLEDDTPAPAQVGTSTWTAIAAGWDFSLGVQSDGTLWAWGGDGDGALAQPCSPDCDDQLVPIQIGTDTDWAGVAAGEERAFAWKTDGSLFAWGEDRDGNLGIGVMSDVYTPQPVCAEFDWTARSCTTPMTGVSAVAVSETHTLALKTDGSLWAWGDNCSRQLGIGGGCQVASVALVVVP